MFNKYLVMIALLSLAAAAQGAGPAFVHFPDLARRAQSGELDALREVLVLADTTSSGERLEELAEIASKFVRRDPGGFLRAQSGRAGCFGVDFMGVDFVDDAPARQREVRQRIAALQSVPEPALAPARRRCLHLLARIPQHGKE